MVTLVIASVLMALAAPSFTKLIANQRISSQANELLADLTFSRSEAIKRSAVITLCKTADPNLASPVCNATDAAAWTPGRLIFVDATNLGVRDAGEEILRIRQALDGASTGMNTLLGDGVSTGTANFISYSINGATTLTTESQLFVCDKRGDSEGLAVVIHQLGRARIPAKGTDKDGAAITACP